MTPSHACNRGRVVRRGALRLAVLVGVVFAIGACEDDHSVATAAEPAPASASGAAVTPSASSSPVRWTPVSLAKGHATLRLPARVVRDGTSRSLIRPLVDGVVSALYVRVGDPVVRGQRIATVAHPRLSLVRVELRGVEGQFQGARARLRRVTGLRREGLAQRDAEYPLTQHVQALEARRANLRAELAVGVDPACDAVTRTLKPGVAPPGAAVCAPAAGMVRAIPGAVGAMVGPSHGAVATLWHRPSARVEVRHARLAPAAQSLTFVSDQGQRVGLAATALSTAIDPTDGATLRWHAANPGVSLAPGLRGVVLLELAGRALRVPTSALRGTVAGAVVVRRRGATLAQVPVRVLSRDGAVALVTPAAPAESSQRRALRVGDLVAEDAAIVTAFDDVPTVSADGNDGAPAVTP